MLRFTNTQTGRKEDFKTLDPEGKKVGMYVCGPTVYDSMHLGHARAVLTPDVLRRYLEYKGYQVRFVMNFTDIDDKIIHKANEQKRDWKELTEYYIKEFFEMLKLLNIKPATLYPRATENIPEMIEIVSRLLDRKNAYVAGDGDVYFDTASYERYGALSGRKIEEEDAGQSQRISEERMKLKKNPGDFVLWKLAKPGEPFWESPWGKGRPGWHLECSAMSKKFVGVPFDIHGGGADLTFPHHEDEKAQTECAYCKELQNGESVRYWIHHGFLTINSEKMSKSLGNARWLREMIWPAGPHDPMTIRMIFLSSQYRAPVNFEPGLFEEAKARLDRIYNALESVERHAAEATGAPSAKLEEAIAASRKLFEESMDDDLNTAGALAAIFDLVSALNREVAAGPVDSRYSSSLLKSRDTILAILEVLGVRPKRAAASAESDDSARLIDLLMEIRKEVRAAKLYALSDKIRLSLKNIGYEVEDLPGGKWAVKKL